MKKLLQLLIAGLIAATLGLPGLATDHEPKSKPKTKAKAKPKPKAKADAKVDGVTSGAQADRQKESSERLNERMRRAAENDQKDRVRGSGASAGSTSSTPWAPSGVPTTR